MKVDNIDDFMLRFTVFFTGACGFIAVILAAFACPYLTGKVFFGIASFLLLWLFCEMWISSRN
jgi:hypothetical protein